MKPILLILNSQTSYQDDIGIKVSILSQVKKNFECQNQDIIIATDEGKKPLIDFERDDNYKDWVKENQNFILNPQSIQKINSKDYSGVLLLNQMGFYYELFKDLKLQENIEYNKQFQDFSICNSIAQILKEFCNEKKIITAIGYGILPLFLVFQDDQWAFKQKNITSISIMEECHEDYFHQWEFNCEEIIRELQGIYVYSQNQNNQMIINDDNLITAQNDASLNFSIQIMSVKIKEQL